MSNVRRLPENLLGRDFVLGDVHGSYDLVVRAMKFVGFKPSTDRLLCVGDLVDRGPESRRALRFLAQPYVHAVRGNHEDMFLQIYADGDEPHPAAVEFATCRNGMEWWLDVPQDERLSLIRAFRELPVVIEVATRRGVVGLVHGEVPSGMHWSEFTGLVEANDQGLIQKALWGRTRVRGDESGVDGIGRVFVGHTPLDRPKRLGNVFFVDTGAVFGLLDEKGEAGRLTISDLACGTMVFDRNDPETKLINAIVDEEPVRTPFGKYAAPAKGKKETER